ncbi:acyl-CoA carboxylase subunit epsilon [Streptomyces sp. NBC_01571]|uniref:acyl-CoA carboxylase subunit epsilon n=1 Tax=Streptomyces sp. NBC_01571 TaxID=2975883 RepID=UPI00225832FB|nr:acyl-CoA carboxylase subunit epsilon [Streptomyces sp. NBC_01571]MCX4571647.1 acyl-CoA carboxylase subunit epsilon [Streptomyces sp. NBC_01571]MCX4579856.1 acyl-CoA carboxylase subunit epsilon [Streptomyces sp. NBC_01571]MCX4580956.1 acyl-CoA carboxylase subunit epsilon [Streptomyces sp. NBC_01571]
MGTPNQYEPVLRVERGRAGEEELAALTVVLLALSAGGAPARRGRPVNGSRWWRRPRAYRGPRGWQ